MDDVKVSNKWKNYSYLLIAIAVVLIYGQTVKFEYNLDDNYIIENLPSASDGLKGIFSVFNTRFDYVSYRPIPTFTVALEQYVMGKADVHVSHMVNVFLFALGCMAGFAVLLRLPIRNKLPAALLIVLIFAAHPIHSNVVCSIKNRDILLSFLFGMLSLYSFIGFLKGGRKMSWLFLVTIVLMLAATLCKADALGYIPVLAFVYAIYFPSENKLKTAAWSAGIIAVTITIVLILQNRVQQLAPITEQNIGSAVLFTENPLVGDKSLLSAISGSLTTFYYYIKFHLWPGGYYFYFGYDTIQFGRFFSFRNSIAMLAGALMIYAVIANWKRDKLLVFGVLFFASTLAYALNFIAPVSGIVAPRLAFIASFGFSIILVSLVYSLIEGIATGTNKRNLYAALVCIPVVVIASIFTMKRNQAWKDMDTLIKTDTPHLQNSFHGQRIAMAHYSKLAEAEQHFPSRHEYLRQALEHARLAHSIYDRHIYVEEGTGVLLYFLSDREGAKEQLQMVVDSFPEAGQSFEVLGDINYYEGNFGAAAEYFKEHLARDPKYNPSYYKLTNALVQAGKVEESIEFNKQLISDYPDDFIGYDNMGYSYLLSGDTLSSAPYFIEAIRKGLDDDVAMYLLRDYFASKGMHGEWLEMIEDINPEN